MPHNHPALDSFALDVESKYGLPPGMLLALKNAGERSDTLKNGRINASSAGAKGVMQFIDSTREAYPHNVYDPMESIDAAGRYMKDLIRQYGGNPVAAIAHYNGGTKAARAVLAGAEPPAEETRRYLSNVHGYLKALHANGATR